MPLPLPSAAPAAALAAPGVAPSARGFLQRLEQVLMDLTTLRVVTVVGDVSVSGTGSDTRVGVRPQAPVEAASTEIHLIDGHIVNVMSSGFSAIDGGAMRAFHQAQVEKSDAIMVANLTELQRLATALLAARR